MIRDLTVAVVGCGNISANHVQAYQALPNVRVIAAVDPIHERAQQFAQQFNIPATYADVRELFSNETVDIVSVCTPHPTHIDVLEQAADAGAHVLCEKPIAVRVADAERMVQIARDAGIKFGAVFQRRFWPAAQRLHEMVQSGELGKPLLGRVTAMLHRDADYYQQLPWRGKWQTDGGGVLMTQTIHYLDLLVWYCGPVREVHAFADTFKFADLIEVEDTIVINLRFESGALGEFVATTAATPGLGTRLELTLQSGATLGFHEFPEGATARESVHAVPGEVTYTQTLRPDYPELSLVEINTGLAAYHSLQIADFVTSVRNNHDPLITGADALNSLRVAQAVYESVRCGQVIAIDSVH